MTGLLNPGNSSFASLCRSWCCVDKTQALAELKSPSFVIGGTASVRCRLHSDNWCFVEPNSVWSLKSELKVQVIRVFQTRRGAPLKFLVSGVFRACVSV